jgi:hypothetical protein
MAAATPKKVLCTRKSKIASSGTLTHEKKVQLWMLR